MASAIGAVLAIVIIGWPRQVPDTRFSYPFDETWYAVAQVVFAVQHAAMLPLFAGLLILAGRSASRSLRIGAWIALIGQVLLSITELIALVAARSDADDPTAGVVGAIYGVPCVLLGVGLIIAGRGLARSRWYQGVDRWIVLGLGVYVFVVLFPTLLGPMILGRIGIGLWLAGFALLGRTLVRRAAG